MKKEQTKIQETEKRLQFTIVIGLFFPVILEALFNLVGKDQNEVSEIILKTGLIVFILVANYLLFEWRKNSLSSRQLDYLNWILFLTVACYALVILFLGFIANGNIASINSFTEFYYSSILVGAMYAPVISIAVMIIELVMTEFKKL